MLSRFIEALLSFLFTRSGTKLHDRQLRLRLRSISRLLTKSRTDFYNPRTKVVATSMAKLLFSIYKEVWFLQDTLHRAKTSRHLQTVVIWAYLKAEQREFYKTLNLKYIAQLAKHESVPALTAIVDRNLNAFCTGFDPVTSRNIIGLFNRVHDFIQMTTFDYYYILRKFDPHIPEHIHSYQPTFHAIKGHHISNLLKDFLEVIRPMATFGEDWLIHVSRIFNRYAGAEIIATKQWYTLIKSLTKLVHSDVLISIIRHIDSDTNYEPKPRFVAHRLITDFVDWLRATTKKNIAVALEEKRNAHISHLIGKIFGKDLPEIQRTQNGALVRENLTQSIYIEEIEYMQRFLRGPFEQVISDFIQETFIVQASWRSQIEYRAFSQLIYRLQELSRHIGGTHTPSAPTTVAVLALQYPEVSDAQANRLLQNGRQILTEILRQLKSLLDELVHKHNYIIMNWKQLILRADFSLHKQLFYSYKRIYYLLELLEHLRHYNSDAHDAAA